MELIFSVSRIQMYQIQALYFCRACAEKNSICLQMFESKTKSSPEVLFLFRGIREKRDKKEKQRQVKWSP
jgi:hypothetical protein